MTLRIPVAVCMGCNSLHREEQGVRGHICRACNSATRHVGYLDVHPEPAPTPTQPGPGVAEVAEFNRSVASMNEPTKPGPFSDAGPLGRGLSVLRQIAVGKLSASTEIYTDEAKAICDYIEQSRSPLPDAREVARKVCERFQWATVPMRHATLELNNMDRRDLEDAIETTLTASYGSPSEEDLKLAGELVRIAGEFVYNLHGADVVRRAAARLRGERE